MEATHFIEVYKSGWNKNLINTQCIGIHNLIRFLKQSEGHETLETIAVWRIKKAESPIQDRLRSRGISLKPYYESIWEQRIKAMKRANNI